MRGYVALRTAIFCFLVFVVGCGDNEEYVYSGAGPGGGQPSTFTREQESVLTAFTQDSVARLVGRTVELAPLISPGSVGAQAVSAQSLFLGEARIPGAVVPLAGDFTVRSSRGPGGVIRLEVYKAERRFAVLDLLSATPRTDGRPGFDQRVVLGPERSNIVENLEGSRITTTIYEGLFFGYSGEALLKYDSAGLLESVEYIDVKVPGTTFATTPNYRQFRPLNGTLTRDGDEMNGSLSYGDDGEFTIRELISETESHQTLLLASDLFGGQGRAFLSSNFDAEGVFSATPDPSLSSPLVNVNVPLTTSVAVNYVVRDSVFQAILPGGQVQGADVTALETFVGLLPGTTVPIPADATLQLFASPSGSLIVGTKAQVYVYAVGSNGRAVPFSVDSIRMESSAPNIVRVLNPQSNQVDAVAAGTAIVVLRDSVSGKSGDIQLTVAGSQTDLKVFAYMADLTGQNIVRQTLNASTGAALGEVDVTHTGRGPLQLLISADRTRLLVENTFGSAQVFEIDPTSGDLEELSDQSLDVSGLSQSQLDPDLYYGNAEEGIVELRMDEDGDLSVVRTLADEFSSDLITALVGGNQIVFGSRGRQIFSIDASSAQIRAVTLEEGAFVTNMGVTRLAADGPQYLEVLVRRSLSGGGFDSQLRSYELNSDGTLDVASMQQIAVDADARELAVSGSHVYNGSFSASTINGVLVAATAISGLPGQPYQTTGASTALAITGVNGRSLLLSASGTKLQVFRVGDSGSLTAAGSVDAGRNITDMKAMTI